MYIELFPFLHIHHSTHTNNSRPVLGGVDRNVVNNHRVTILSLSNRSLHIGRSIRILSTNGNVEDDVKAMIDGVGPGLVADVGVEEGLDNLTVDIPGHRLVARVGTVDDEAIGVEGAAAVAVVAVGVGEEAVLLVAVSAGARSLYRTLLVLDLV